MIVGVLSDIHGNLPALEAVLHALPPIDLLLCCGDVVGYYPDANQVCAALRGRQAFVVRGNHDAYVTGDLPFDPTLDAAYRVEWTRSVLEADHLRWLGTLPVRAQFRWGELRVSAFHASPWDEDTYLHADSPRLAEIVLGAGEISIFGHTHRPALLQAGQGLLVNPGSVGQPRDWDPRPSFALLDTKTGTADLRRVSYGVSEYQRRLETLGWDPDTIRILGRRSPAG